MPKGKRLPFKAEGDVFFLEREFDFGIICKVQDVG